VPLALIRKKKRREEGIEEGVFIDERRPINGRLGSYNIDIDVTQLTPTGGSSVLPIFSLTRLLIQYYLYRHIN